METKRPVVLNGIAVVATRPDLIDRVIHVDLPTIAAEARRDDADTHAGAQLHGQEGQDLPVLQPDQTPTLWCVGQHGPLPTDWVAQREVVAAFDK